MKVSIIATVTAALSVVHGQAVTAKKTMSNLAQLQTMSSDLNQEAKKITLVNGFQTGPELINGYHQIIKQANKDYREMSGGGNRKRDDAPTDVHVGGPAAHAALEARATTYTAAEQQAVCKSYASFAMAHQALLATTIGKHGILEATGVAYQTAAVLRGDEGVLDEIAFTLIGEVPDCAAETKTQKQSLDKSLTKAIKTYAEGLP